MEYDENQEYIITGGTKKFNGAISSFFNVMIMIADRMPKSDYNHGLKIFESCIYTHTQKPHLVKGSNPRPTVLLVYRKIKPSTGELVKFCSNMHYQGRFHCL